LKYALLKEWEASDLKCRIITSGWDSPNGYVGIPRNHPYWGKNTFEIEAIGDIHGGLTFGRRGSNESELYPNPDLWWYGFDTHHVGRGDWTPFNPSGKMWTVNEVEKETVKLAKAFAEKEGSSRTREM